MQGVAYGEGDYDQACRMIEESDWNTNLAGDVNKAAENWSDDGRSALMLKATANRSCQW